MKIDKALIVSMFKEAASSPKLRFNYDLRTSSYDTSQRMLNAVLPGTKISIHRHRDTTECVFILTGRLEEVFYDDKGMELERIMLDASLEYARGCVVPKGVWHTIVVYEPSVIFESKDGAYVPQDKDDVMNC